MVSTAQERLCPPSGSGVQTASQRKSVAQPPDFPDRRRRKMRRAAQRLGVAIALQETAPRFRRLRLVDVELHRYFRIARLQGRMHQVAGKHRVVPAAAEREGDMARRVAGRRQDARVVADRKIIAHELMPPGLDDRQHAVDEGRHRCLGVLLAPVIELALGEYVARIRKGRHPAAIFQPRIPADVIDMQMRAHHEIDVADGKSRRGEAAQKGVVGLHIPVRPLRPRLVVADAAVDQDGVMRRLHDIGLEAQHQHVIVVERARRAHPRAVLGQQFRRQARQHLQCRQERHLLLDDAMDREIADGEFQTHFRFPAYAGGGTEIFTEGRSSIF